MKLRKALTIGLALAALTVQVTAHAEDEPKRPRLRRQVVLLRAELAELATQMSYVTRQLGDGPGGAPSVPNAPGGICGDPCTTDSDEDGIGDCEDYCPCDPNIADEDADSIPDCADPCLDDPIQACIDPCNVDSDGDGTNDCDDVCPWDPAAATDSDADGIPDCQDFCPDDPANICFEPCNVDRDGDGVDDCDDVCPWVGIPTTPGAIPECLPPVGGLRHRR